LGGYVELRTWNRIEDRLEANALAFDDGDRTLLLVSIDTLYIGAELLAFLDTVARQISSGPVDLLAFASHTHFAPVLDGAKPELGGVDPAYLELLKKRLRQLLEDALSSPGDLASVREFCGTAEFAINRRLRSRHRNLRGRFSAVEQTYMAPNPDRYLDRRLRIKALEDQQGRVFAAVVHFGCHPTSNPDSLAISADYVAALRAGVRERFGPIPTIFLQGSAGDIRVQPGNAPTLVDRFRTLVFGPHFARPTLEEWRNWRERVAAFARNLVEARADPDPLTGSIQVHRGGVPVSAMIEGGETDAFLSLTAAAVGQQIRVFVFGAEPLAGWVRRFPEDTLVTGYSGECFGYLPQQADVASGGYEVEDYQRYFGLPPFRWRPDFEERVMTEADRLLTGL
jgi:hypothetical protein